MKLKEVRAELERQLLALELEKKKTQDSLLVLEKKFSFSPGTGALSQFRMRELLREIIQQQNTVRLELNRLEKKEKNSVPDPKSVLLIRSLVISLGIIMLVPLFFSIILYEGGEGSFSTSALAPVPALLAEKNSFSASEGPILELRVPVKNEITGDFIFSSELQGLLRTPTGVLIPQKMEKTSQGYAVTLSSTRTFEPGKYSVVLRQGHTLIMEQNFTWGVLALNTNKARYRPGEDAFIGIAVLDDAGNMICNAVVILTITNPDGQREVLSTGNEKIIVSPDCAVRGVTLRPDYYTAYTFSRAGVYAFNLTAFTYQGTRSILETIPVSDQMLFEVYRTAATRIYPPQPYSMNITLHSQEYYQGTITEIVPASFDIQAVNATVTSINEEKEITWNVTVLPHHNYTFSYLFDAPDVSPQFYLLGPLQIGEWKENRSWQIAADAVLSVTLDAPDANLSKLVGDTFTFTCTATCTMPGNPPTVTMVYNYSTLSTCAGATAIDTSSTTPDVLMITAQNVTTACSAGTSATVVAQNAGTVHLRCTATGSDGTAATGGCRQVIVTTASDTKSLLSIDIINTSVGSSSQGGGFVVSSTSGKITNGSSLTYAAFDPTGLSRLNLSSIININMSLIANSTHGNYVNVTFGWMLAKSNGSTMLNTTLYNSTLNQTGWNYSFNTNLLPDGIYNISVYVQNVSKDAAFSPDIVVNYSRGFDIAVDRTPPNVTLTVMNTSNATNYRVGTLTEIQINATFNDSTTFVQGVRFGIFSVGNSTEFNITPTQQGSYWFINLALGPLASGNHIVRFYGNDTLGNLNNTVSNLSFTLNLPPTPPVTGMPANDSAITNRTPIFDWFNSSDVDGDVISYHIQVDDNARFNNPEINVSSIQDLSSAAPGNTTWYSTIELAVDTRFYWRVRANDSFGYGNWSNGATVDGPGDAQNRSNFTVSSLLSITMFTAGVEFGTVAPGTMTDTSDGVPAPFRSENTGNIDTNVSLNASVIFVTVPINRSAYQFRIRANESNAFSSALSATSWTNMTNSPAAPQVVNLTWRDVRNDFLTDINLSVPNDEPPGFKTSTITFTVTRNE